MSVAGPLLMVHALDIDAQAKRRLADKYDAVERRGEVGRSGAERGRTSFTKGTR
jgi:hypothetical protein